MGKRTWKRLLLLTVFLVGYTLVMTPCSMEVFAPDTLKRRVEVISLSLEGSGVLATEPEEENSLFYFSLPEGYKDLDSLRPGTLLDVAGPADMMMSFPGLLGEVEKVKKAGERPDFMAKYYDSLKEEYRDGDKERLYAAIQALDDLNDGERLGLLYLLDGCF